MTKLTCRNCKWETDKKHFGFISEKNNNHLCMVCVSNMWGGILPKLSRKGVVKHYEKAELEKVKL